LKANRLFIIRKKEKWKEGRQKEMKEGIKECSEKERTIGRKETGSKEGKKTERKAY